VCVGEDIGDSKKEKTLPEQESNSTLTTQNPQFAVSTHNYFDNLPTEKQNKNLSNTDFQTNQESVVQSDLPCTTNKSSCNNTSSATNGGHRAGIDAFMTGYCLATYLVQCGNKSLDNNSWLNKISLSGKEVPLTLARSHFSRPSASHTRKMKLLKEKISSL
jgi:hypothetical protein